MLGYMFAIISSIALQCQLCSQHSATTLHEQVLCVSDAVCCKEVSQALHSEDDSVLGPLLNEAVAGLGPMRSRVPHRVQGVGLETLLEIVKTKLRPSASPQFQQMVKARELHRELFDRSAGSEDWLWATEVYMDTVAQEVSSHVCGTLAGVPASTLLCRERWHIEHNEARASMEISNEPANAAVTVVLRIDIADRPDTSGPCS